MLTGRYTTGFALGLLAKEEIAADLAEAAGIEAPACRLVSGRWSEAVVGLGFGADHSEAHKQWWSSELAGRVAEGAPASG